jgi:DNA-binding NtrC family response regulator
MTHKILVVDDEPEICKIIKTFLTKKGFEVLTADSGEKALAVLGKEKADLVILDKKMPGIGGQGALDGFKKMRLAVPVVILTGSIDLSEAKAIEMGCAAILNKPIDLNVLLETVNKVLNGR